MRVIVITAVLAGLALPVQAASKKETTCGYQADVVGAVQKARLDRERERKVVTTVEGAATWPDQYNAAIPLVTPWVYEMKMADIKTQDLAAIWKEMCLAQ